MTERGLKREYVHAPLHSVCGMAVPQLVWVNVEPCGSAPLPADLPDGLPCEMPIPPGTREDELFIRAAAKSLKEAKRCWSKGNTSLTAAATGSQCTKWKQVPLSRHEKAGCSSPRNPASTQIKSF